MIKKIIHCFTSNKCLKGLLIASAMILLIAVNAHALITYTNPNFHPDDYSQVFTPCTCMATLEWYDRLFQEAIVMTRLTRWVTQGTRAGPLTPPPA